MASPYPQKRQQLPSRFSGRGYDEAVGFANDVSRGLGIGGGMAGAEMRRVAPGLLGRAATAAAIAAARSKARIPKTMPPPQAGGVPFYFPPPENLPPPMEFNPRWPELGIDRAMAPVRQGLASMFRSGQPAPVAQPAPLTQPAPVAQRWPEVEEAGPMWNDAAASTAQGLPPMQTMIPMDAVLGMRQGAYQRQTFLPQTVKQRQSAGFFSMSPAAQAASMGGADAIGEQGLLRNSGVPGGYAQAGVNPGFGDRTGLAVHRAPLPQLNQLGAVPDPVRAEMLARQQRDIAKQLLQLEGVGGITKPTTYNEWAEASKQRLAAANEGFIPNEVPAWEGPTGRGIAQQQTSDWLRREAASPGSRFAATEDRPALADVIRGRRLERQAGFQLPLEERRELLAQKRTGMSRRQREIAMGLRMTPEEFAADQQRQAYEAQAIGMGIAGTGEGPLGLQRGQAGEIGSAIRGGLPTTREGAGRIPAAERKRVQKELFPDDAVGYVDHMIEGGMSPEEAAADAVSRYDLDRSWLQQFYEGISRGISPDIEILSPEEMLLLERDANAGDAAAKKRLKEEKTKQWAQWVSGIGGAVGAGIRDRVGRMLGFIK